MAKLPLAALRAFAAVCETGGVRPAARVLKVSHSAVSRHVRELEAWLGVPLFEMRRESQTSMLTMQGAALGKAAIAGLADLEHAIEAVRELRKPNSVVIAATASLANRWLIPRLPALVRIHPWIEVSVVAEQTPSDPAEQGADIALRMGGRPALEGVSEPLMDDALYPVATLSYWRGLAEKRANVALAKARLLHDRDPNTTWDKWFLEHPTPGVDLRSGSRFTSSDLVLRAASHGLGVALARARLVESDLSNGALIRPFGATQVLLPRAYWLIAAPEHRSRPAVEALVQWIRAQAQ